VLSGIVGEAVLAVPLADWLAKFGVERDTGLVAATILVVVVITFVSIVIGELVPKRLGQLDPEGIARLVARPMNALATAAYPFVWLLSWSTATILRLLGHADLGAPRVTQDEIHALLQEGSEAGVIEPGEHHMVRNVFRLDDLQFPSLMVPRVEIAWLDLNRPLEENLTRIAESVHAAFPVCRGGFEDIAGVAAVKQLFSQSLGEGAIDLGAGLEPAVFVPESLTGMELLEEFRANDTHMVFVVDEYGDVLGLVTLRDLIEAVTGEFQPRNAEDAWAIPRGDGSWLLDGLIPVPELKDRLGLKVVPEEEKGRYNTLCGMFMWLLGRVPQTTDRVEWEGWRLEIVDMDGRRIDKVLATPLPDPDAAEAGAGGGTPDQP
ncbi:MAG TPA: hemolysin family protein, partial [Chromatiaceae bacterium]|nr:hemolysin family protein [Chromatiaceae bacterium]